LVPTGKPENRTNEFEYVVKNLHTLKEELLAFGSSVDYVTIDNYIRAKRTSLYLKTMFVLKNYSAHLIHKNVSPRLLTFLSFQIEAAQLMPYHFIVPLVAFSISNLPSASKTALL
jgi:hypothetical protein